SSAASVSAALGRGGDFTAPLATTLAAGILLIFITWTRSRPRRAISATWRVIFMLAFFVVGLVVAARAEVRRFVPQATRAQSRPTGAVELDIESWVGQPVSTTPVKAHVPQLTALTLEGRSIIVFFNPACGLCHELFSDLVRRGLYA